MIVVSVFLPSDPLSQCLPSYLGFSYLGCGVSLHGCSSNAQPLLLTSYAGWLLSATSSALGSGVDPFGCAHAPSQPPCSCNTTLKMLNIISHKRNENWNYDIYIYDVCILEYYLAMKKNEILPFVTMDLESIMLTKISQIERDK